MTNKPLSLIGNNSDDKIRCSITEENDIIVSIPNSVHYNNIIIKQYKDSDLMQKEQVEIEPKDARLLGIAKAYHQYISRSWNFPYYDTESDRYARENKDYILFKRTAKICRGVFDAKLGISPCVFGGITAIPIKRGYENIVVDGVESILSTFQNIKSGSIPLLEFKNGDPIFEFCLFLAKRTASSRSNVDRSISARVVCAFWNAYLEGSKLENLHHVASNSAFIPLVCCPISEEISTAI